jgi:glutamate formiminotransferase
VTLECVVNVSEGRDLELLGALAAVCDDVLLDVHRDSDHHRSVFTLGGPAPAVEQAARSLTATAVARLDLTGHDGRHPRIGVVDVVPFVPLPPGRAVDLDQADELRPADELAPAIAARDRFTEWAGTALSLPCFLYGPLTDGAARTLPAVRRDAFGSLRPDTGPPVPHPTAGGCAVGARPVLVAYNLWLADGDHALARSVASALRGPAVRALGLDLAGTFQVSCNLVRPLDVGPADVYDRVAGLLDGTDASITGSEVVGLVPAAVLDQVPTRRWPELDLRPEATIEARLGDRSLRPS